MATSRAPTRTMPPSSTPAPSRSTACASTSRPASARASTRKPGAAAAAGSSRQRRPRAKSTLKEGLLFVGTDDGLVQISEDGAQTWRKIDKFPGVPDLTYVTDVHPSPTDAHTVYVTLNDFQRGNFKPYVVKSADLGRTWTSIAGDLPDRDPVWSIVQDHINPRLFFVGTEFGLSFSIDGGAHWIRIANGMPTITRSEERRVGKECR